MMKKRGYLISEVDKSIINATTEEESMYLFNEYYYKKAQSKKIVIEAVLGDTYVHPKNSKDNVRIIYIDTDPTKNQILKEKTDEIIGAISSNVDHLHVILISRIKFAAQNYKDLHDLKSYWIEHFLYEELLYDPTIHVKLQPEFLRLLSMEESQKLCKELGPSCDTLQPICIDDPVIKFLGGQYGQLLLIVGKLSHVAVTSIRANIRRVVNNSIFE